MKKCAGRRAVFSNGWQYVPGPMLREGVKRPGRCARNGQRRASGTLRSGRNSLNSSGGDSVKRRRYPQKRNTWLLLPVLLPDPAAEWTATALHRLFPYTWQEARGVLLFLELFHRKPREDLRLHRRLRCGFQAQGFRTSLYRTEYSPFFFTSSRMFSLLMNARYLSRSSGWT